MSRHHRSKGRGSSRRARLVLLAIFLVYCGLDAWLLWIAPPEARHDLLGSLILWLLGITGSLLAIWLRQNWARYVLCLILGAMLVLSGIAVAQILQAGTPFVLLLQVPFYLHMLVKAVVNIVVIVAVVYLPWIRTLTLPR